MPGPRDAQQRATRDFTPGPHLPTPDASRDTRQSMFWAHPDAAGGGPPLAPVEGGELAGNLFERGMSESSPVLTSAVAACSRERRPWTGDSGGGARVGGVRPGPGGEGSGEGSGSTSLPTVAIKSNRVIRIQPGAGASKAPSSSGVHHRAGRVEQVQVEQSAGHADLDEAAVDAVGRWRFEPARGVGRRSRCGCRFREIYAEPITSDLGKPANMICLERFSPMLVRSVIRRRCLRHPLVCLMLIMLRLPE